MKASLLNEVLMRRLNDAGVSVTWNQAATLRRAEKTLRRWGELECGDGNDYGSWSIERGGENGDGKPEMVHHHYLHGRGKDYTTRRAIPDRQAGALRRVAAICKELGAHFYHQGDPRGACLYVSAQPITGANRGVCCCVE